MRGLLRRMPLRVRLVALMLVLAALSLGVAGVVGTVLFQRYIVGRLDSQLTQSVMPASGDCGRPTPDDTNDHGHRPGTPVPLNGFYVRCLSSDGSELRVFFNPATTGQTKPNLGPMTAETIRAHANKPFDVASVGGDAKWRVLVVPASSAGSVGGAEHPPIVVALSLDEVDRNVTQLILLQSVSGVIVLALLGFLAYVLVRSSLRPLVAVEQTAEAIAAGDLTQRVPEADPRTEVGGLAKALNTMLGQIETAFAERAASEREALASEERMRRFVADASHELRTPLTSIRGFAELYPQHGGEDPTALRLISRIEHHAVRMGLLVDDLLLLARVDQQRPLDRQPVDLLALAVDAVVDARVTAPSHTLLLRTEASLESDDLEAPPPVVLGDEPRLRQVLANLLSNAFTHTPAGTEVTVRVGTEGGRAILSVSDNGPGMSEEDARRVFERFYRTDPSRNRAMGGSGLGLSIVAALVAAHGGEVSLTTAPGAGAAFRVMLPLA